MRPYLKPYGSLARDARWTICRADIFKRRRARPRTPRSRGARRTNRKADSGRKARREDASRTCDSARRTGRRSFRINYFFALFIGRATTPRRYHRCFPWFPPVRAWLPCLFPLARRRPHAPSRLPATFCDATLFRNDDGDKMSARRISARVPTYPSKAPAVEDTRRSADSVKIIRRVSAKSQTRFVARCEAGRATDRI